MKVIKRMALAAGSVGAFFPFALVADGQYANGYEAAWWCLLGASGLAVVLTAALLDGE